MLPLTVTWPVPFGASSKSAFEVVTMSCPFMSKLPPNCGLVSSTISAIPEPDAANPATSVLLEIFFNPPPEVSTANKTSSFATEDISDKSPTAVGL